MLPGAAALPWVAFSMNVFLLSLVSPDLSQGLGWSLTPPNVPGLEMSQEEPNSRPLEQLIPANVGKRNLIPTGFQLPLLLVGFPSFPDDF